MRQEIGVAVVLVIALLFVAFAAWQTTIAHRATDATRVERVAGRGKTHAPGSSRRARFRSGLAEAGLWTASKRTEQDRRRSAPVATLDELDRSEAHLQMAEHQRA